MNPHARKQVFISIFVSVVLSFGIGYFVASKDSGVFKTSAQASEQVDMSAFWKVWNTLNEKYVSASSTQSISDEDKLYGAISGLARSLDDPYTLFLPPEDKVSFDESLTGTFSGVGMEVGIREEILTVISPLKDSPAQKAGMLAGDIIISIDKKNSVGMSVQEAVNLIRGEQGTVVTLEILREGEKESRTIEITRDTINVPTIETEVQGDVFVIRLYTFGTTATVEFRNALREMITLNKKKLILDLRGNPGGYLEAAVDISSWFLPAGKVVVSEDFGKTKDSKIFRSKGYNIFGSDLKMVILIDKGSASASEIVAGALNEHGVAQLVGQQSYGKGSVQELIPITSETALKVTIARWLTPKGTSISNGGLAPDIEVEFDRELYKESEKDTQFIKALEILK